MDDLVTLDITSAYCWKIFFAMNEINWELKVTWNYTIVHDSREIYPIKPKINTYEEKGIQIHVLIFVVEFLKIKQHHLLNILNVRWPKRMIFELNRPAVQVYPSRWLRTSCRVTPYSTRSSSLMVKPISNGAIICFRPQEDPSVEISVRIVLSCKYSLWTGYQWVDLAPAWLGGRPWMAWSCSVGPQSHEDTKFSRWQNV